MLALVLDENENLIWKYALLRSEPWIWIGLFQMLEENGGIALLTLGSLEELRFRLHQVALDR